MSLLTRKVVAHGKRKFITRWCYVVAVRNADKALRMDEESLKTICSACGSEYGDHITKTLRCPFPDKKRKRHHFVIDLFINGDRRSSVKLKLSFHDFLHLLSWRGEEPDQDAKVLYIRSHVFVGEYTPDHKPIKISKGMKIEVKQLN